ncbi:MAG: hypothetical protein LUP99_04970, partial [Methanomicrobiales archaeon]|nr:hypothetical protein [Methanomicrobiales archaeon]
TLAKKRVGSDIETIRSLEIKKFDKYPMFRGMMKEGSSVCRIDAWKRWTEMEAYAKFSGIPFFMCLHGLPLEKGYSSQSYVINDELVATIMSDEENPVILFLCGEEMTYPGVSKDET